jgi:hypothetical protein
VRLNLHGVPAGFEHGATKRDNYASTLDVEDRQGDSRRAWQVESNLGDRADRIRKARCQLKFLGWVLRSERKRESG